MSRSDPDGHDDEAQKDEQLVEPDVRTVETDSQESINETELAAVEEDVTEVSSSDEPKVDDYGDPIVTQSEWQLWPPSPKMQILLIALMFGLFNFILLGIWAAIMVYRFN